MSIRDYAPADRAACLAIFDGNVPTYFHVAERPYFAASLASVDFLPPPVRARGAAPGRYRVVERAGAVVACGGWYVDGEVATLSWGMVDRALHRTGVGRALMADRLDAIRAAGTARQVRVQTTTPVRGFFERFGFAFVREGVVGVTAEMPLLELVLRL